MFRHRLTSGLDKLRIVRLSGVHFRAVSSLLTKAFPDFLEKEYQGKLNSLFKYKAVYSDSFSRSMERLEYQASELICDFEVLQKQWAVENGIEIHTQTWMFDILLAQIKKLQPEVVYFQGTELCIPGRFTNGDNQANLATILKECCPFIKLIVMFSGHPSDASRIKDVDILFACSPAIVRYYQHRGVDAFLCYHGFDKQLLDDLDDRDERFFDFTFAGSTQAPRSRYWILRELMECTPLELWVDEFDEIQAIQESRRFGRNLGKQLRRDIGAFLRYCLGKFDQETLKNIISSGVIPKQINRMASQIFEGRSEGRVIRRGALFRSRKAMPRKTLREMYPDRWSKPVLGNDYFDVLRGSRITFNNHTERSMGSVGNMRLFEATGIGTCLLTDTGDNMRDLFIPGKEVITYRNTNDAVDKVKLPLEA